MSFPDLSEALIRQQTAPETWQRGREYARQGAVEALIRRGAVLEADVWGSEEYPYRVRIASDHVSNLTATCTCPYDWGGWCKHIVAVCLAAITHPEQIAERSALDAILQPLTREQLQSVLLTLAERETGLTELIEAQVALIQSKREATPQKKAAGSKAKSANTTRMTVNSGALRQQVRAIVHGLDRMRRSDAYWHVGGVVSDLRQMLEQVWEHIRADDGLTALSMLEAITDTYLKEWEILDDSEGEASMFFNDLGPAWTEGVLSANLTEPERHNWATQLDAWDEELVDFGVDGSFRVAALAAEEGWDDPLLRMVLRGKQTQLNVGDDADPGMIQELTAARLHVLERRGRLDEYLHLARAAGEMAAYATMLVRVDRIPEAMTYARLHFTSASDALALAQALFARGERDQGLQIAEHGLTLTNNPVTGMYLPTFGLTFARPRAALAIWLRDVAADMGEIARALVAGEIALHEDISLANYLRLAEIAGHSWPDRRAALLTELHQQQVLYPQALVDIYLHEDLIDDAITVADAARNAMLVNQVVDAAQVLRPAWVLEACKKQAEPIMNEGRAQHYDDAVAWLAKARAAYHTQGRTAEWHSYLTDLLAIHRRKYKLVPMLKALA